MLFRRAKTVRVGSKEELDAALATADQVIVEGSDELLSYAVNRASRDPGNVVEIDTSQGGTLSVEKSQFGDLLDQTFGAPPLVPALIARKTARSTCRESQAGAWKTGPRQ